MEMFFQWIEYFMICIYDLKSMEIIFYIVPVKFGKI